MDSVKGMFTSFTRLEDDDGPGGNDEESLMSEFNQTCKLSAKTRMYGFVACFCLGFVLSIMGTIFLAFLNLKAFALFYSLGSITSLCSTAFLLGPMRQLKTMFDQKRWIASTIFLASIALTLGAAIGLKSVPLSIIAVIIQFLALGWYCLSYIPYGRAMVTNCCKSATSDMI